MMAVAKETSAVKSLDIVRLSIRMKEWGSYVNTLSKCVSPQRTMKAPNWKTIHLKGNRFEHVAKYKSSSGMEK